MRVFVKKSRWATRLRVARHSASWFGILIAIIDEYFKIFRIQLFSFGKDCRIKCDNDKNFVLRVGFCHFA